MAQSDPQPLEAITDLSASALAQKIQAGELSAQAVVEAHIRRIEAVNPLLNALVIPLFEEARAQAVAADNARDRGDTLGSLHGVPVTIKEQYRVKGTQTTLGATHQIGNVYDDEGPLVRKLRASRRHHLGKIGMYTDNGYFPASPALRRAVTEAADALRARGATVAPFTPPDVAEAMRIFLGAVSAGGGKDYKRLLGDEKPLPQVAGMFQGVWSPPFVLPVIARLMATRGQHHLARAIQAMGARPTENYWQLVEARNRYRMRFHQALDEGNFAAVLCPPFALPAVTHGATAQLFPAATYAIVYNVLGAPAGVVSITKVRPGEESDRVVGNDLADITAHTVEQGSAGLPVAVQVVARHWQEEIVLAVMAALEAHFRATPDYPARPDFNVG